MNSADAWYEDEETRDVDRSMEWLLDLSVELAKAMNDANRRVEMEAAKARHPAGKMLNATPPAAPDDVILDILNASDRCDQGCGGAALYRFRLRPLVELDLCHHHHGKLAATLKEQGWVVVGTNTLLNNQLYANRLKGEDHA